MRSFFWILSATTVSSSALWSQPAFRPAIPKTWDEAALADWATPVAGLNVRPTHITPGQYYSWPVDDLKTYPVYFPGREPVGYWEMLHQVGPKLIIEPARLKTEADWIEAGRIMFHEADDLHLRTLDPKSIEAARTRETYEQNHTLPLADGTIYGLRWVPTSRGVTLSVTNCAGCHLLYLPDDTPVPGAPTLAGVARERDAIHRTPLVDTLHAVNRVVTGAAPFYMGTEPLGSWLYQAYGVPWRNDDINEQLKTVTRTQYGALINAAKLGGAITRWNGSLYYPTKIPDLIGISERKYIDATGTHLNRGVGDLMRYAALVSTAEATEFGPHQMLAQDSARPRARRSDEALYALALYVQSLRPPHNPNPVNEKSIAGEKIFKKEGCGGCHTPPLYTSNKLTLAQGFTPPDDLPPTLDVFRISVGTDAGLALKTRKGTGYYKVPSLKGAWYRGHYLHDGSAASLEEMFDPDRLDDQHQPGGYSPPNVKNRAIKGHVFGLKLNPTEREQLLAFLRTL
jgi:mono/diheme cytochrome c family protein